MQYIGHVELTCEEKAAKETKKEEKKVRKTKTAPYSPKEIRRGTLEYNFWIGYCVLQKIRRGLVYRHNIRYESLL